MLMGENVYIYNGEVQCLQEYVYTNTYTHTHKDTMAMTTQYPTAQGRDIITHPYLVSQVTVFGSSEWGLSEGGEKCASSDSEPSKLFLNGILASRSWICKTREDVEVLGPQSLPGLGSHVSRLAASPRVSVLFQPNCSSLCDGFN